MSSASGETTLVGSPDDDEPAPASRTSAIEAGAVVGRYVVLQRVGAGGMAVVYAAYDPELDRKVALKLVLPGRSGDGRIRLLREAQALARLAHPNVVGIHDVGTVGEQVWLAMEFVQGRTLSQWLATPRGVSEVLRIMREAGEGLAAAHAAELLHRDFKPDNVMIGDDGRVRVMDFGLARASASERSLETREPAEGAEAIHGLSTSVTRVGALVGTPSYMAPEQIGHGELSAATDQFAFCVALWEALYGERPFCGDTQMELLAHVLAGELRTPTSGRAVPGWLRRACERGLLVDPTRRWPSMRALLDTLAAGRKRAARRKGLAALGALALLGAGVEAQRRWDLAQRTAACEATGAEVDVAWNEAREQGLRDALLATGASHAATTVDKLVPWLERQASAWREARVETCLDVEVRGRWDASMHERASWCLEERRAELESLVDELGSADVDVLHGAVTAAAGLASVAVCRDEDVLETLPPPPEQVREELRAVRDEVIRAGSLEAAGRYDKGLEQARSALERAEAHAWLPLVAATRLRLGSLLARHGAYPEAESELEQAYFDAARGAAPEVALGAATRLVGVVGTSEARHAEALRWARLAEVVLLDVSDREQLHRASLLRSLATVHRTMSHYDEAQALHEQVVAIMETALGPEHPRAAQSLIDLAHIHKLAGHYEEAKLGFQRGLDRFERALGPDHPFVANSLNNLGSVAFLTGDYDEAKRFRERALAIQEAALGPESLFAADTLNNLGNVQGALGAHDEAKAFFRRALAIWERSLGSEHAQVALALHNLALVHQRDGQHAEAARLYERVLAIYEKKHGPEHPDVAAALHGLAEVRAATGDHAEAKALYERALAIWERALGAEHPELAFPLNGLATLALARQHPSEAIAPARRAVELRERAGVAADSLARSRFVLAMALWEAPDAGGRDRAAARSLAEQAREPLRALGTGGAAELAELEAWLAAHALVGEPAEAP